MVPGRARPAGRGRRARREAFAAGEVLLTSSRFACDGCVRRARGALDAERGVTGVEVTASGRLLVRYDSARANPPKLAEVARAALEADPHNPPR